MTEDKKDDKKPDESSKSKGKKGPSIPTRNWDGEV